MREKIGTKKTSSKIKIIKTRFKLNSFLDKTTFHIWKEFANKISTVKDDVVQADDDDVVVVVQTSRQMKFEE